MAVALCTAAFEPCSCFGPERGAEPGLWLGWTSAARPPTGTHKVAGEQAADKLALDDLVLTKVLAKHTHTHKGRRSRQRRLRWLKALSLQHRPLSLCEPASRGLCSVQSVSPTAPGHGPLSALQDAGLGVVPGCAGAMRGSFVRYLSSIRLLDPSGGRKIQALPLGRSA